LAVLNKTAINFKGGDMSNTGTYRFNKQTNQVEKVSDSIPALKQISSWMRKMDPVGETNRCNANTRDRTLKQIYSKD